MNKLFCFETVEFLSGIVSDGKYGFEIIKGKDNAEKVRNIKDRLPEDASKKQKDDKVTIYSSVKEISIAGQLKTYFNDYSIKPMDDRVTMQVGDVALIIKEPHEPNQETKREPKKAPLKYETPVLEYGILTRLK